MQLGSKKWGEMEDSYSQGDPFASPAFNITWHEEVMELDNTLSTAGEGFSRAGDVIDGNWEPGFMCVGAPIGTDAYCKARADEREQGLTQP